MDEQALYEDARAHSIYGDDGEVKAQTEAMIATGKRVLQIHRLADTEEAHCAKLLEMFNPPHGAKVLDIGCGIGEPARLMAIGRPDLTFALVNISPNQLGMCPPVQKICADMSGLPVAAESFDAVLITYALGHGLPSQVLEEAARVLRPGGVLFIYDIAADDGAELRKELAYTAWPAHYVTIAARTQGFTVDKMWNFGRIPYNDVSLFMTLKDYLRVFDGVKSVAYRFVK